MIKLLLLLPLTIIPFSLAIFSIKNDSSKKRRDKDSYKYDSIFVKFGNRTCVAHLNSRKKCGNNCSVEHLRKITSLIHNAQKSISICMYHITISDVYNALIKAHERGVHIRMITDLVMKQCSGSVVSKLKASGILVHTQKCKENMMHHKFMLIDEFETSQEMLFGSCNFTLQALVSNWEHILITNNKDMIIRFSEEFDDIWNEV